MIMVQFFSVCEIYKNRKLPLCTSDCAQDVYDSLGSFCLIQSVSVRLLFDIIQGHLKW